MTAPAVVSWLIIVMILGVMATMVIWARVKSRFRGLAVIYLLGVAPLSVLAVWPVLGKPVPVVRGFTVPAGHWAILGHKVDREHGEIYLMLDMGDGEPSLVSVPYTKSNEEKMQQIANAYGTGVFTPGDKTVRPLPQPDTHAPKQPRPEAEIQ